MEKSNSFHSAETCMCCGKVGVMLCRECSSKHTPTTYNGDKTKKKEREKIKHLGEGTSKTSIAVSARMRESTYGIYIDDLIEYKKGNRENFKNKQMMGSCTVDGITVELLYSSKEEKLYYVSSSCGKNYVKEVTGADLYNEDVLFLAMERFAKSIV